MMSSGIRASDHDRDRTARLLREHHAVGRLDPEEFAERLDQSVTFIKCFHRTRNQVEFVSLFAGNFT